MQVEGEGAMTITNGHGNTKIHCNVYLIPSLSQNLLSIGQLMASFCFIVVGHVSCVTKDKNKNYENQFISLLVFKRH